jgi:hypothetical protein
MMAWGITLVVSAALIWAMPRFIGFRSERPCAFAGKGPAFDPALHLNGPIQCEGVIYGPLGRVSSRFVAKMEGVWDGNRGRLHEVFRYDEGSEQQREWRLVVQPDGGLRAEADDLAGQGEGQISGPTVQMLYRLRLPASAGGHVVKVVDWMVLMENGNILNRSRFYKFGIPVAELVATIRRVAA